MNQHLKNCFGIAYSIGLAALVFYVYPAAWLQNVYLVLYWFGIVVLIVSATLGFAVIFLLDGTDLAASSTLKEMKKIYKYQFFYTACFCGFIAAQGWIITACFHAVAALYYYIWHEVGLYVKNELGDES